MNNVERFEAVMSFRPVDRLPVIEWAVYWDKTLERWYNEGLPRELENTPAIHSHFDIDRYLQFWFVPRSETCPEPVSHGAALIRDKQEYQELKAHLYPKSAFDRETLETWAKEQAKGESVIWITLEGFFWHPRMLIGIENHLYAFHDNCELMHMINSDLLEYNLWVLDEICKICTPNFMTFAEDMSYNNGPMISKKSFDEVLAPYYHKIVPQLCERGIVPFIDSDGDVIKLIPWLEEVGIEGILPLERMAGVDVMQIRNEHPDFKMIGGFDKTKMHLGEEAMREEFERLLPVMKKGRFIPSVDHQTPPEVSLETYFCYVKLLKEYCLKVSNT